MTSLNEMGRQDAQSKIQSLRTKPMTDDERAKHLSTPSDLPAEYRNGFEREMRKAGYRN